VTDVPNRNVLWARSLAAEWANLGVTEVCIGSGSRSAPLVEAFSNDERFRIHPHVDERSAAFLALGVGAATGRPAAVVTTSGTAAVNLFPAVVEASQSGIPLLLVTADRPASLRGSDANQTIDQVDLFGQYPRLALDLSTPELTPGALDNLRDAARRAWVATVENPCGPVQVNVQFEKPLDPTMIPEDTSSISQNPEMLLKGNVRPVEVRRGCESGDELARLIDGATRPLIICGPNHDSAIGRSALTLASALGSPVVGDPLSGTRFAPKAIGTTMGHADLSLSDEEVAAALNPDVIVRVGRAPTSASTLRFLKRHASARQIVLDGSDLWKDHLSTATHYVVADPATTLRTAANIVASNAGHEWLDQWRRVDAATAAAVAPTLDQTWFEGAIAAAIADGLSPDSTWFIGNSMPIRDVDAFAGVREQSFETIGFRGASGIDGNVSGAIGAAIARGKPAVALIGDLTLLHDVGALLVDRSISVTLRLIVVQNRGGGIFHMLPIREYDPPFTPYLVMPQQVELSGVAAAAGIPHSLVASIDELRQELKKPEGPGLKIVEAQIDRYENWDHRETTVQCAQSAARSSL